MARNRRKPRLLVIDYSGNPTHNGHLRCGKWMAHQAQFDHVFFAVSGNPATRNKTDTLDAELRYDLAVAATAGDTELSASRVNLYQPGMSWALTAIEGLQRQYPDASISYGISGEYLDPNHRFWLKNWIGAADLFKSSVATVFPRADQSVQQLRDWAKLIPRARIDVFYAPGSPISGTQIRQLVQQGRSAAYLAPDAMLSRLHSEGSYRLAETPVERAFDPTGAVNSVGIFLSEFDPVTLADLRHAETARQSLCLDRVEFLPVAGTFNRPIAVAPAELRYQMALAATAPNPYFKASRYAIDRPCVSTSFTLLDKRRIYAHNGQTVKLTLLFNADWLDPAHPLWVGSWSQLEALLRMCRVVAVASSSAAADKARQRAQLLQGAAIEIQQSDSDSISAPDVRGFVAKGLPATYSVPTAVENIIFKNGLYRPGEVQHGGTNDSSAGTGSPGVGTSDGARRRHRSRSNSR